MLSGKILVTGGSGFLARALYRRAELEGWPAEFTCLSRDETKQWHLKHSYPNVRCVLGDIRNDVQWLKALFHGYDTVFHFGAIKYIPEAEWNVNETIDVNVNGSRNVAMAAMMASVETVIFVSTDKACAPLNTYGITKALTERLFSELNRFSQTNFVNVRYGNVVGSTGSVIPVFRKQLLEDNIISVTDKHMTRFWLGPDQAINQVLWALHHSDYYRGYTFINACSAMKIVDLAEAVWLGQGNKGDVPIRFTGIRPGEKLHETLFNDQEGPRVTKLDDGFIMKPATEPAPLGEGLTAYSSDKPYRWLDIEEMIILMQDAALV